MVKKKKWKKNMIERNKVKKLFTIIFNYYQLVMTRFQILKILNKDMPLEKGEYYIEHYKRPILYKNSLTEIQKEMLGILGCDEHLKIAKLIIDNEGNEINGQVIMLTARGYKIFDYKRCFVYKRIKYEDMMQFLKAYKQFSPYFKIPYNSVNKDILKENLINFIPYSQLTESDKYKIYKQVIENYIRYVAQNVLKNSIHNPERYDKLRKSPGNIFKLYNYLSENAINIKIPDVFVHGDLHFGNILVDKNGIWYIDFEYARDDIFFFDIYNILFIECVDENSTYLLKCYLKGNNDLEILIKSFFDSAGFEYDTSKKKNYIYEFLKARLIIDWETVLRYKKSSDIFKYGNHLYLRYKKFIEKIEEV